MNSPNLKNAFWNLCVNRWNPPFLRWEDPPAGGRIKGYGRAKPAFAKGYGVAKPAFAKGYGVAKGKMVSISRAKGTEVFSANFILVAAINSSFLFHILIPYT
jgi:hypothetical protein